MVNAGTFVEPVIQQVHVPAGVAGPVELSFDVRCFLVGLPDGLVLIDAGPAGSAGEIGAALERVGAHWSDVTDVVLTHSHPDHVGGLGEVAARTPGARIWAGAPDCPHIASPVPLQPLSDDDRVRDLRVIPTPGHTKGHISLLHEGEGLLFVGDAVGTLSGSMMRAPAQFTADAAEAERSLRRLSELAPARMLFSHGPEVTDPVAELRRLLNGNGGAGGN
ncbi:MBL fold metallo-hydrolase [Pseudarthrobacter albicanus]|uniref:MBL fold metallo-hydrolase n=1 Tax=Pseudarthrobacter albicanus TaxID=2823873 RepID=UPI001BAD33AB|nr:MBL fold metallo-hydrolase [Pseudarthrobacter albicanus]